MALSVSKQDSIPEGAIILTENEAFEHQLKLLNKWKRTEDIWPLKFGPGLLGAAAVTSALYINNHFRRKLKLGNYGRLSSYLPIVLMPAICVATANKLFTQKSILLGKEKCVVCLQGRSTFIQLGLSILYPLVLSPISSFFFATRHFTMRLPSITKDPKQVFEMMVKMVRPIHTPLAVFFGVQTTIAMVMTYKQLESMIIVNMKLQELERKIEDEFLSGQFESSQ